MMSTDPAVEIVARALATAMNDGPPILTQAKDIVRRVLETRVEAVAVAIRLDVHGHRDVTCEACRQCAIAALGLEPEGSKA